MNHHSVLTSYPQHIPYDEWWQVFHYTTSLSINDTDGATLWLAVRNGERHWIHEGFFTHFDFHGGEAPGAPDFIVPVSPRAVFYGSDIATTAQGAVLSCVDNTSLMVSTDSQSIVFDAPLARTRALVWPETTEVVCRAVVSASQLAEVLHSARTAPVGLKFDGAGPPLWCTIGDGAIKFHSDWSRYGHGRVTSIIQAQTVGATQFHAAVSQIERLLAWSDTDDDTTVTIEADPPEGIACRVVGPGWTVTAEFIDAVAQEWAPALRGVLGSAGVDFEDDGPRAVEFMVGPIQIRAQLHDTVRPSCRLSAPVAHDVDLSEFILNELNDFNQRHAGIKFWWEHSMVVAAIDLDCAHLADLPDQARCLGEIVTNLSPLVASA